MNFNQIEFETSFGRPDQLVPSDRPEIAFVGRSNVGKSSMINKVFGRKNVARVSSSPGKTVTINFFTLGSLRFVDLPGYGFAKVSKEEKKRWAGLMEAFFSTSRSIELVLALVDFRHLPTDDDMDMIRYLKDNAIPFTVVLTKADKIKKSERQEMLLKISGYLDGIYSGKLIEFSAQTGEGCEEIRRLFEEINRSV